ncbi:hypothetical protein BLA29_009435 [Euroglyphus maynei]|uniref:BRCT domain-containing protein n=1 Tax=Euroglyphus maynei TaxID=6958 RepID=A0A1Y3BHA8_EURMA|nr:hypothetical protein BLA29_009435 [Euroglyphus maynei]
MQSFNQHQSNVTGPSSGHHHAIMQPHHSHSPHPLGQVRQTFGPNVNQQQHPHYISHPPHMQQHPPPPHANRTMVPFHHHYQQQGNMRQIHLPPSLQQQHLQSLTTRFYGHETLPGSHIGAKSCLIGCTFYISSVYAENRFTKNLIGGWKRRIEKFGGKVVADLSSNNVTHVITEHLNLPMRSSQCHYQKMLPQQNPEHRYVSIFWLNDVLESERLLPPWRFYHLPVAFNPQTMPCKHHVCIMKFDYFIYCILLYFQIHR